MSQVQLEPLFQKEKKNQKKSLNPEDQFEIDRERAKKRAMKKGTTLLGGQASDRGCEKIKTEQQQ